MNKFTQILAVIIPIAIAAILSGCGTTVTRNYARNQQMSQDAAIAIIKDLKAGGPSGENCWPIESLDKAGFHFFYPVRVHPGHLWIEYEKNGRLHTAGFLIGQWETTTKKGTTMEWFIDKRVYTHMEYLSLTLKRPLVGDRCDLGDIHDALIEKVTDSIEFRDISVDFASVESIKIDRRPALIPGAHSTYDVILLTSEGRIVHIDCSKRPENFDEYLSAFFVLCPNVK